VWKAVTSILINPYLCAEITLPTRPMSDVNE